MFGQPIGDTRAMKTNYQPMRQLLTFFLVLVLSACAATGPTSSLDNVITSNYQLPDKTKKIVILPLQSPYAEFDSGKEPVVTQLYGSLIKAGYKPVVLQKENYQRIWAEETEAVGGLYDTKTGGYRKAAFEHALSMLARRIAIDTDCSLVLAPSFAIKTVKDSGEKASWDGVSRRLMLQGSTDSRRWSGTSKAISLELIAVNAAGQFQFKTYGGLVIPYVVDLYESKSVIRTDMFSRPEEITEGVNLALLPILGS